MIIQSTRRFSATLERPRKRRCIAKEKKAVTFSPKTTVRSFFDGNDLQARSSWLTDKELSSMKKRARSLAMLHHIKTRPDNPTPSKLSGIVYNCHPAHYEIIGESLRGMECYTDISNARRRERLRSDAIDLVLKRENLDKTSTSKLACMYKESTKEASVYAREKAEEDANIAAAIFAEELKQDFDGVAPSPSTHL